MTRKKAPAPAPAPQPKTVAPFYQPQAASPPVPPPAPKKTAGAKDKAPAASLLSAMPVDKKQKGLTADVYLATDAPKENAATLQADIARIRAQRKPFGTFTQKLAYAARPGYHRHWFSDEPGRVDEAVSNGWAHVKGKDSQPVKRVVGRARDGGPMYGYLLELPSVFWDEDMAAKHDAAQARVDEIKKNPIRAKPGQAQRSDAGKFYSPKEEAVSVSESVVRSRSPTPGI